jgi:hypothetical protein
MVIRNGNGNSNTSHTSKVINKIKRLYDRTLGPPITMILQLGLWYTFMHLIFWSIEQLRYKFCISSGIYGFFYSMIASQSLVCVVLTEASKVTLNGQFNNLTIISSFIGIKLLARSTK